MSTGVYIAINAKDSPMTIRFRTPIDNAKGAIHPAGTSDGEED